jgi:Cu(I)/Ag(I) efflux system membrane protein CusA/SilA
MIARLIRWCAYNRTLVILLTALLVGGGAWSAYRMSVDAIPDLSDVQVVIRTEYAGQAPQIVEDQVTYPLTTAMLAVPYAKVVRGYSMFGTSFVYVIFEDGTDLYWARSRVLEQLSSVTGQLPRGLTPQLGPDATGVGWVYEYALVTGKYCLQHPDGAWHDPLEKRWYASAEAAPESARPRLIHHRVFEEPEYLFRDPLDHDRYYHAPADAPVEVQSRLVREPLGPVYDKCPLDGGPLADSKLDLAQLRGQQDWYLRYALTAVDGVSEVAPIGGFVKQYQVVVDPIKLLGLNIPLGKVKQAIQRSNVDVGGRLIELSETEYMLRGVGYLGTLTDDELVEAREAGKTVDEARSQRVLAELGRVSLGATNDGKPIYLDDVAQLRLGPEIRRGVADWNGRGETVGGVIVMRFGENARQTIENVRAKLSTLERGLPPGVGIRVAYDRSDLIERAVHTLTHTLVEEMTVVSLVILLFLLHARSALVAVVVLPIGVLSSLLVMKLLGMNANIMSLGGIALAIGVMVDSAIIMVENAHKHLDHERERLARGGKPRSRVEVVAEAAAETGPTLFFSLLIITVSFLPIFVLGEQSGRLFKPLAYTKTFAVGFGALLAVTIIPVLMVYLISERTIPERVPPRRRLAMYLGGILGPALLLALLPLAQLSAYRWALVVAWLVLSAIVLLPQRIHSEDKHPLSRFLQRVYSPAFTFAMAHPWLVLSSMLLLLASTAWPFSRLGSEFMPPLDEGDLLYMPTTDPGISMDKVRELLQQTDALIKQFPEVETVFGKAGRAQTATDPAPPSMLETTIRLYRDKAHWRSTPEPRFYSGWPGWLQAPLRTIWADSRPISLNELIYGYNLPGGVHVKGLNEAMQIPGLTNAWTMPIKTRIDMLSTGIKTPVGIKVLGPNLATLAQLAQRISQVVRTANGTGPYTVSAYPEKTVGGNYLDIRIDRGEIARYGLNVGDVQDVIMSASGGVNVGETVEALERYPINVRYPHELRDNLTALRQMLVPTPSGAQVPLAQLATLSIHKGPPMLKSENAVLTSWVYVDIAGIDVGTYVKNAQRAIQEQVQLPPGYSIVWSGQYEYMEKARQRLLIAVPLAAISILVLLYLATRSWLRVGIVALAVPFSLIGASWLVYLLGYNLSLAVWVGVIALAGLDAETGLVMLLYLDQSFERFKREGRMRDERDLWHAIHDGAVQRIRPKMMTVMVVFVGLVPLLWGTGAGADTMRRLAAPMIGGLATSFVMELVVYPVIFFQVKRLALRFRSPQLVRSRPSRIPLTTPS